MQSEMTSTLASGLQKVVNMDGAASDNPKLAQLSQHTVNYDASQNARITTDFGTKVNNTDHWLSVSTDDHYGPTLLEDGHGREKVVYPRFAPTNAEPICRSTDLITSAFLSVLYTRVVLRHLGRSSCMRARQMSQTPVSSLTPLAQHRYFYAFRQSLAAEVVQILFVMSEGSL